MFITFIITTVGLYGLSYAYLNWKKRFVVQYYFVSDQEYIPWIERTYNNESEREYEQDQLVFIALDSRKNSHFRQSGVVAITSIDTKDNAQIFYVVLNKD